MSSEALHLNSYHTFLESRAAKIKDLVLWVLRRGNCTDAVGHTPEVINDIHIKVKESWSNLRSPEDAINTITKNTASTHATKCRREIAQILDDDMFPMFMPQAIDPAAMYEQAILIEELRSQLADPVDRETLDLLFQGFTYAEIAVVLSMESSTLRSRFSRAMKRLKQANSPLAPPKTQEPIIANND